MATTNYGWTTPVVGGSENTWGASLNSNWEDLDDLLGGTTKAQFDVLRGTNTAGGYALVPSGGIIMWSGTVATIPSGWLLCDGTNGTPNLQDRFVVGAGNNYNPGDTGGADSVTLTTSEIPSHTHTGTTDTDGAHSHDINIYDAPYFTPVYRTGATFNIGNNTQNTRTTEVGGAHSHAFTTDATGGGSAHENRPPYYALAYIMKA